MYGDLWAEARRGVRAAESGCFRPIGPATRGQLATGMAQPAW